VLQVRFRAPIPAYWVIDEWEEDAEVAISIFRAIELFYIDKKELLKI
jgi:hypothetical protein